MYKMQTTYRYVRVEDYGGKPQYLCLQQNPFLLGWLLFLNGKPFGFPGRGIKRFIGRVPRFCRTIIRLCYHQLRSTNGENAIELPVYGHLCLQIRHGYKVFDFCRQKVVKVFSPNTTTAFVTTEIDQVRLVGQHDFAPSVRQWNIEGRWYEEDYTNGYSFKCSDWPMFLQGFQTSVASLVARMILVFPPQEIGALVYVEERSQLIQSKQSKLADKRLDATKVDKIRSFVEGMIERLRLAGDRPISLVCSHGDFYPGHVLSTRHGAVIVDWETLGRRSALHDLYNYFFDRLRLGYATPGMAVAMQQAIAQVQSHVALNPSAENGSLLSLVDAAEVYRWTYYIECICKALEQREKLTDAVLDEFILRKIDRYDRYEARLLDDTSQVKIGGHIQPSHTNEVNG